MDETGKVTVSVESDQDEVVATVTVLEPLESPEGLSSALLAAFRDADGANDLVALTVDGEGIPLTQEGESAAAALLWGDTVQKLETLVRDQAGSHTVTLSCEATSETGTPIPYKITCSLQFEFSEEIQKAMWDIFHFMRGAPNLIPGYLGQETSCASANRPVWFSVHIQDGEKWMVAHVRESGTGKGMTTLGSSTGLKGALVDNPTVKELLVLDENGNRGEKLAVKKADGSALSGFEPTLAAAKLAPAILKPMGMTTSSKLGEALGVENSNVTIVLIGKTASGISFEEQYIFSFAKECMEPKADAFDTRISAADGGDTDPYPYP